jgi:hypothetical protein
MLKIHPTQRRKIACVEQDQKGQDVAVLAEEDSLAILRMDVDFISKVIRATVAAGHQPAAKSFTPTGAVYNVVLTDHDHTDSRKSKLWRKLLNGRDQDFTLGELEVVIRQADLLPGGVLERLPDDPPAPEE